jgi:hypothetical protein
VLPPWSADAPDGLALVEMPAVGAFSPQSVHEAVSRLQLLQDRSPSPPRRSRPTSRAASPTHASASDTSPMRPVRPADLVRYRLEAQQHQGSSVPADLLSHSLEDHAMMSSLSYLAGPLQQSEFKWLKANYPGITQGPRWLFFRVCGG